MAARYCRSRSLSHGLRCVHMGSELAGLDVPGYVDTGAVLVTSENVDDSLIQGYLDPRIRSLTGK